MSKMSELDSDRQRIARLADVIRPPSFARTAQAVPVRTIPPPPPPTTVERGGLPLTGSAAVFWILVGVAFATFALFSMVVLGVHRS